VRVVRVTAPNSAVPCVELREEAETQRRSVRRDAAMPLARLLLSRGAPAARRARGWGEERERGLAEDGRGHHAAPMQLALDRLRSFPLQRALGLAGNGDRGNG